MTENSESKVFLAPLHCGDPYSLYRAMAARHPGPSFLLESSRVHEKTGRWSFVLTDPFMTFRSVGDRITVRRGGKEETLTSDPFACLRRAFGEWRMKRHPGMPPFVGGAVGLFAYELKNRIEAPKSSVASRYEIPDIDLAFFDKGAAFDHVTGETQVFAFEKSGDPVAGARKGFAWAEECRAALDAGIALEAFSMPPVELKSNAAEFMQGVLKIKEYVRQGDVFQVNLSHCFEFPFDGKLLPLYERQRVINPTPFAAYADFGDYKLLCGSPERLVRLDDGVVSTRPIAGTRPRASDPAADRALSAELLLNAKERAEHVMLLDLERNDLGRVCEYGSVRVDEMMAIEDYSHVRHIVSNVTGRLRKDRDVFDLLRAVFPGGTITGAPKVRAMQIIDELEGKTRGAYTGSFGYAGFDGSCDLNIVIRSLVVKDGTAYLSAGSGIVADSDPEKEYLETIHKAQALLKALEIPVEGARAAIAA